MAYLKVNGGLHFGVRKCFVVDEDGKGVIPVTIPPTEAETEQAQMLNERMARGLKYERPDINTLRTFHLTDEMERFLLAEMDGDLMDEELVTFWDAQRARLGETWN